jgi:hypothetical protein
LLGMDDGAEDPGWSRSIWARWWLDHDDAGAAASELEPGDEVDVLDDEFPALAQALHRMGLAAIYEDGHLHVHTPDEAAQILAAIACDQLAASDRRPPVRAPASPIGQSLPSQAPQERPRVAARGQRRQ